MVLEVKDSCPHYRFKPEENKVTTCNGTVIFEAGSFYGTCQTCKKQVPMILEC